MSVIENRSTFGDKFVKGLSAKVYELKNQVDQEYVMPFSSALGVETNAMTGLFKMRTTTQAREVVVGKAGVGQGSLTEEGSDYASDSRVSTYETEFRPKKRTNGITITEEQREDKIVDRKLDEAKDIMVGHKMDIVSDAFSIFNKAFTAQASLSNQFLTYYGDGKNFCSTIHPIKNSINSTTTQSNASSTGIALTETNLETGRTALRRQLGDRGRPMNIGSGSTILLVPDALEKQAIIIARSTKRSNVGNNDLNIYDGIVTVMSTKWINSQNGGSDTQWFLIDGQFSPIWFMERKAPTIDTYFTNSNKNFTIDIASRYQIGNVDFRGVWGSLGAGAAYSS